MSSPANASISVRSYFYPLPYPIPPGAPIPYTPHLPSHNTLNGPPHPLEPTSTLVLTSTTSLFVDIRLLKPTTAAHEDLPNTGGPRSRLEWAFAGKSESVEIADPYALKEKKKHGGAGATSVSEACFQRAFAGPVRRAVWTHWVDSRYAVVATRMSGSVARELQAHVGPPDTGIMYPLPVAAGESEQTLEFGQGVNYYTGALHSYEELWTDLPILATPTAEDLNPPKYSIVLGLDESRVGVRGCVVRLGQFCQGIVMKGGDCTVERWEFVSGGTSVGVEDTGVETGEWKRVVRIGDLFLPCPTTFKPNILTMGGKVKYYDYEWTVEEKVVWRDII